MAILEPLIAQLLLQGLLPPPRKHRKAGLLLLAAAGMLSALGVVYLFIGCERWLTGLYGPITGPLLAGASAMALGGLVAIAGYLTMQVRMSRGRELEAAEKMGEHLFTALEKATRGLDGPIASNPKSAVLMASVAGYMAGEKIH